VARLKEHKEDGDGGGGFCEAAEVPSAAHISRQNTDC
jgi:hypothetical protein